MRRSALLLLVLLSACAHPKPPAPPPDLHSARLAAAAAQLRAGCFDCLLTAYREYEALKAIPAAAAEATAGIVRTAALISIRQRELGLVDDGYLQRARDAAAGHTDLPPSLVGGLDVIDAISPASVGAGRATSDDDLERMRLMRTNRDAWSTLLRQGAQSEIAAAYIWLSLTCASSDFRSLSRDEILAPTAPFGDTPLMQYRKATCRTIDGERLQALLTAEPRFHEIEFTQGQAFVARQRLDDADKVFDQAYRWHPAWPTLTLAIANVGMTAEEFERALTMYNETLKHEPKAVDALLGKVRALTFLGRSEEAIAAVDVLLAERWYVGDGRYWRAVNELQLERFDEAWADVELAAKLLVNAEVPKLAGIIAYRRRELEVSRAKFDESLRRKNNDCETGYYLGLVLAELREWSRTAEIMPSAGRCLQDAEQRMKEEIAEINAGEDPPARKARKIAKREQSIATGRRWMATSWFNTAVAFYNLAKPTDAREYAERVVEDEQFGDRARDLIARLR